VKRAFIQALTGKDNVTIDIARVLWAVFAITLIYMEVWDVCFQGHEFRPLEFTSAAGSLLVMGGFGVSVKAKTEPDGSVTQ